MGFFHISVTHRRYGDLRMGRWRPHGYEDWGRVPWVIRTDAAAGAYADEVDTNRVEHLQPGTGYHQTDVVQKVRFGRMERHLELNLQHSTSSDVPRFDRLNDAASDGGPKWAEWDYGPQDRTLAALRFRTQVRGLGHVTLTSAWQRIGESRLKARLGAEDREVQVEGVDVASLQLDIDHRLGPWNVAYGGRIGTTTASRRKAWMERRSDGFRVESPVLTRYPNGGATMGSISAYGAASRRQRDWFYEVAARAQQGWLEARFEDQPGLQLPFDQVGYDRGSLTGSGTVRWQWNSRVGAHGQLATAFRNPNVDDVGKVRAKDGFVVIPADSLRPERLFSAEVGGHWRSRQPPAAHPVVGLCYIPSRCGAGGGYGAPTHGWNRSVHLGGGRGHQFDPGQHQHRAGFHRGAARSSPIPDRERMAVPGHLQRDPWPRCGRPSVVAHPAGVRRVHGSAELDLAHAEHPSALECLEAGGRLWAGVDGQLRRGHARRNPSVVDLGLDLDARLTERTTFSVGVHNALDRHYKVFASGISAAGRDLRVGLRWRPAT